MALNDARMLPEKVRKMAQMEDLLQAEQILLNIIESILIEMLADASISNNVPMTKDNSEYVASVVSGSDCYIDEYPDILTIDTAVSRQSGTATSLIKLRSYMNDMLPAHLKFNIHYEFTSTVLIKISSEAYRIPHDLCGEGYAGEYPDISVLGKIVPVNIVSVTEGKSYLATYKLTGEEPVISTTGNISNASISPVITSAVYSYEMEFCSADDYCGED